MNTFSLTTKKSVSLNELLRAELPRLLNTEISNSKIRRLIMAGSVSVNNNQIRVPAFTVYPKSSVTVRIDAEKLFFEKTPDDISFELSEADILFEDECIIVLNKPTHFPTESTQVESRDNLHASLVRFLFERQKIEKPNAKNPPYAGIMHRLDRDTSGVILFTKTRAVNGACHAMFENHTAQKTYQAIVCVTNTEKENFPVGKHISVEFFMGRISPKSQAAKWGKLSEKDGGVFSKTEFTVLKEIVQNTPGESKKSFLLVECRPLTGRTHQIRVHLSSLGIPILGDTLYDGEKHERIMLHATRLVFPHPVTGEEINVTSEFSATLP